MAEMKPCYFCGKKLEQPHTYPKFDNGTVYGCIMIHNCPSGIKMQIKSVSYHKTREEAMKECIQVWNGEKIS